MITDTLIRSFSFIVYVLLLNFFFSSWSVSPKVTVRYLLTLISLIFGVILSSLFIPPAFQPFLNIAITVGTMFILANHHDVPIKETVFWVITLLALNFISESVSLAIVESFLSPEYNSNDSLFVIVITIITILLEGLIFFAIKLVFLRRRIYDTLLTYPTVLALTSIPIVSIIVLVSFLLSRRNINIQSTFFVLLVVLGILYMNICALYLYSSVVRHLQKINQITLQNKALTFEMKYISEIKKTQTELNSMRHDLKNQFLVLLGLIEHEQLNEAKHYLKSSIDQVTTQQKFYTNDVVLNYLLNDKKKITDEENINFNINVLLGKQSNIDHDILAILIGNLVDNAIQATNRLAVEKEPNITLTIKQFDGKLLIDINNTYDPEEKITRQQRQYDGLGISNIKQIVNNYNGLYRQWTESNQYFVSIILLNVN